MTPGTNAWDTVFATKGAYFREPHAAVIELAQTLYPAHACTLLDLGCGSGRHTIYCAQCGVDVLGLTVRRLVLISHAKR